MPALLLLLLLPCLAAAQPDTTWSQHFRLNDKSYLYDVTVVGDSMILGCGYAQTGTAAEADLDFLICAYSITGEQIYARTILETDDNEAFDGLTILDNETAVAVGWSVQDGRGLDLVAFDISSGDVVWDRHYQLQGRTKGRSVIRLADGRLAAVGYRGGVSSGSSDAWIVLCESNGDTVWTRTVGGSQLDVANSILQKPNGNLLIGAITASFGQGGWDQWLIEFDLNGNQIGGGLTFGSSGTEACYEIVEDPNANYWLVGRTTSSGGAGYATAVRPGGPNTSFTYFTAGYSDQFMDAIPWFGGLLFVGRSGNIGAFTGPFMRTTNGDNQSVWGWRYGAQGTECGFNNVAVLPNGGAVAVGALALPQDTTVVEAYIITVAPPAGVQGVVRGASDDEPIIGARVQALGDSRFTQSDSQGRFRLDLAAGTYDIMVSGRCIEADTAFGIITVENELTDVDFAVGQPIYDHLQSSVNIIAPNEAVGSAALQIGNSGTGAMSFQVSARAVDPPGAWISVDPPTGILTPHEQSEVSVIVHADTSNDGIYEFFGEITIRSNACPDSVVTLPVLVTVLETGERASTPGTFSLSPAYPNPFNSSTNVTLDIPAETELQLDVFNIEGRWVKSLIDNRITAGRHSINIDLTGQAAGLYVLRAQSPYVTASTKLLYIR